MSVVSVVCVCVCLCVCVCAGDVMTELIGEELVVESYTQRVWCVCVCVCMCMCVCVSTSV